MNQSQTVDLQVKLALDLPNSEQTVKRIPTAQTFKDLLAQCQTVLKSASVPEGQKVRVHYRDSDNDKIEVSDDYELQMAYATALSADCKVKFFVELPGYQPPMTQAVVVPEQPAKVEPVVVAEEPIVQAAEEPQAAEEQPVVVMPEIEADMDDGDLEQEFPHHHRGKGKKGKGKKGKGKKGKCPGDMPRRAIKNLIRAELETAVPGIYDKLIQEFEAEEKPVEVEESKEQRVVHEGIICDSCGMDPIKGIRYKCSVRKDFDLCEKCEESIVHPYPFLKIRKAGGAPSMILTVLNEDAEGTQIQGQPDWKQMKEAWKQVKQQYKPEGPCRKQGKEWTEEECAEKAKFWKNMVQGFMGKMGMDAKDFGEMKKGWHQLKEQWKQQCADNNWDKQDWSQCKQNWQEMKRQWKQEHGQGRCGNGPHGQGRWGHGPCGGRGEHKIKRAVVVSNPDVVLECAPGCVVLHDIEVKNNTQWGWKQGVFLGMDSTVEQVGLPIELVNVPVDQKVEGNETLKLTVPITVLDSAKPQDEVLSYKLRFRGPKGGEIGEPIPIKLKIVAPLPKEEPVQKSHLELVKIAVKLFDTEKLGQTFNEVLESVTLVNGDEDIAKKSLQPRQ